MFEVTCLNSDGDIVNCFYQWDLNQKIILGNFTVPFIPPKIHFCNKDSVYAIEMQSEVVSGEPQKIQAFVPNILLQEATPIYAYVYMADYNNNGSTKTIYKVTLPVKAKTQHSTYRYSNNVPSVEEIIVKLEADVAKNVAKITLLEQQLASLEKATNAEIKSYLKI